MKYIAGSMVDHESETEESGRIRLRRNENKDMGNPNEKSHNDLSSDQDYDLMAEACVDAEASAVRAERIEMIVKGCALIVVLGTFLAISYI